jgi:hypothetical protein
MPSEPAWRGYASQTFLKHADQCLHSAWLYKQHQGGPSSVPKQRGVLLHLVWQRMLELLQERGESTLYARQPGEGIDYARRQVASLTEQLVEQVREENPQLHVPHTEADAVRQMAYHLAVAMPVDPQKLVAIEGGYVLDIGGWEVRCRVDTAELHGDELHMKDVKTSFALPSDKEYESSFQRKTYSLALIHGWPLERVDCGACGGTGVVPEDPGLTSLGVPHIPGCLQCEGRGYMEERQERDPRIAGVNWVVGAEIYPRYLRDDFTLAGPTPVGMNRTDLNDFRVDLERLVATVDGLLETGEQWPAVPGHHCFQCAASHECPLPAGFRGPRGTEEGLLIEPIEIQSAEHAAELAQTWHWHKEWGTALRKALRGYSKETEEPIRFGRDLELSFRRVNKDGGRKVETVFDRRRLSAAELEAERDAA